MPAVIRVSIRRLYTGTATDQGFLHRRLRDEAHCHSHLTLMRELARIAASARTTDTRAASTHSVVSTIIIISLPASCQWQSIQGNQRSAATTVESYLMPLVMIWLNRTRSASITVHRSLDSAWRASLTPGRRNARQRISTGMMICGHECTQSRCQVIHVTSTAARQVEELKRQ